MATQRSGPRPVKVAVDVTLPSSRFGPHTVELVDRQGGSVTLAQAQVEIIDGKPEFIRLDIGIGDVADAGSLNVSPAALANVDWNKAAWDAVFKEAADQVWGDSTLTPLEMGLRFRALDKTADESRRYNRLTAEQMDEVLELWHQGGAQAVANHFCVSRRQADRYVKRARQEAAQ